MIPSVAWIVILGLLANRLSSCLRLPGLLGMILAGVAIGPHGLSWLDPAFMAYANDIRMMALIVILLRAGLGLEKQVLKRVGVVAFKMSAIPCLLEGFAIMGAARVLLQLPWVEAGMLGFIIAAVTPAVIVPAMLELKAQGRGMRHNVPVIVLAGASVDDVFAITAFTGFLGMAFQTDRTLLSLLVRIPVQIVGGILVGAVAGWALDVLLRRVSLQRLEIAGVVMAGACAVFLLGERLQLAGLLGVMTMGFVLLERDSERAAHLDKTLDHVWFIAQLFLFVLIGAEVDLGVAWQAGLAGLAVITIGLLSRSFGVLLALLGTELTGKERLFTVLAYLPKATVQAAIGGIPLALGVASGATILAVAVLSVVLTASVGAIAIQSAAPRLLELPPPPSAVRALD